MNMHQPNTDYPIEQSRDGTERVIGRMTLIVSFSTAQQRTETDGLIDRRIDGRSLGNDAMHSRDVIVTVATTTSD